MPPVQPMLAKSVKGVPASDSVDGGLLYEPKWDGFRAMVRGATPDVVLTGVELLADAAGLPHGVAVVDVGGATTDVHSVVRLDAETAELRRDVVAVTPVTRTVEGDLGMRWSAASTASAAVAAGLAPQSLLAAGEARTADPGLLPEGVVEEEYDRALASAASVLAVRRHAGRSRVVVSPEGRVVERTGKDLRDIDLLIGSGGVFRNVEQGGAVEVLAFDELGCAPGQDVRHQHPVDIRMRLEQLGERGGELAGTDHSDGDHCHLSWVVA